jgi:NAD-dependent SIR2 family protein deacetylase
MNRIGFLLGAGASYPFGVPMMREFYEGFCSFVRSRRHHCWSFVEALRGQSEQEPDLELLISQIEKVRSLRHTLTLVGALTDEVDVKIKIADELRGYLEMYIIDTCERFVHLESRTVMGRLVKFADENSSYIFSTNYDRLIEDAAEFHSVPCADGFEVDGSKPERRWTGQFQEKLKLLKLHGSVNWYEEAGSEQLYRLERGYSLPSHEYLMSHEGKIIQPLMIIPTMEKMIAQRPYAGLLTKFLDALNEIDVLIVIGNSLRDDHLRNCIIERCSDLEVILVNPSAKEQGYILRNPDCTHEISTGVREFLTYGYDYLVRLAGELGEPLERSARRQAVRDIVDELGTTIEASRVIPAEVQAELAKLSSDDAINRLASIRSLSAPLPGTIADVLRSIALNDPDPSLRVAAIDALAELDPTSSVQVLERIATSPGPLMPRLEAALALRSMRSYAPAKEAWERMLEATKGDRDLAVVHADA